MRIAIVLITFIITFPAALTWQVFQAAERVEQSTERLSKIFEIEDRVYREEIEKALAFAPPGKTIYQLRGDAQIRAQSLLNLLTMKYEQTPIRLSGIRFRPVLIRAAAGASSNCQQIPQIELSEIFFYRNYDAFMNEIIPHEIAHIGVCLKFGDYIDVKKDDHDERWESVMRDLGFHNPANNKFHKLDMAPTHEVLRRIRVLIDDLDSQ